MTEDDWEQDNPFEDIIKNFFGSDLSRTRRARPRTYNLNSEEEERIIDFIESKDKVFLIFELPGYDENDLDLKISSEKVSVTVKKKSECPMQEYLSQKLCGGEKIVKTLPEIANHKIYEHTFKNGILEIEFEKNERNKHNT